MPETVVVYGNSEFAGNFFIEFLGNRDLFVNSVQWLARQPQAIAPALAGEKIQTLEPIPACFHNPGWVHLLYPNGWSKYGWLSNIVNNASTFANPQPNGSQIDATAVPAHVRS